MQSSRRREVFAGLCLLMTFTILIICAALVSCGGEDHPKGAISQPVVDTPVLQQGIVPTDSNDKILTIVTTYPDWYREKYNQDLVGGDTVQVIYGQDSMFGYVCLDDNQDYWARVKFFKSGGNVPPVDLLEMKIIDGAMTHIEKWMSIDYFFENEYQCWDEIEQRIDNPKIAMWHVPPALQWYYVFVGMKWGHWK